MNKNRTRLTDRAKFPFGADLLHTTSCSCSSWWSHISCPPPPATSRSLPSFTCWPVQHKVRFKSSFIMWFRYSTTVPAPSWPDRDCFPYLVLALPLPLFHNTDWPHTSLDIEWRNLFTEFTESLWVFCVSVIHKYNHCYRERLELVLMVGGWIEEKINIRSEGWMYRSGGWFCIIIYSSWELARSPCCFIDCRNWISNRPFVFDPAHSNFLHCYYWLNVELIIRRSNCPTPPDECLIELYGSRRGALKKSWRQDNEVPYTAFTFPSLITIPRLTSCQSVC